MDRLGRYIAGAIHGRRFGLLAGKKQPMKLAAMEGVYEGSEGRGLIAVGVLNPEKKTYDDDVEPFLFKIEIPKLLSILATRHVDGFCSRSSRISLKAVIPR